MMQKMVTACIEYAMVPLEKTRVSVLWQLSLITWYLIAVTERNSVMEKLQLTQCMIGMEKCALYTWPLFYASLFYSILL
jgi:hypothetical protein